MRVCSRPNETRGTLPPRRGAARITGNRCLGLFTVFRCRRCKELERRGRYSDRSFNVPWYTNAEGALDPRKPDAHDLSKPEP